MTAPAVPNVKRAVILLLADLVDADTATPADLVDRLPFTRVTGSGGGRSQITARRLVNIDVFASSEKACDDLAEDLGALVTAGPHVVDLGGSNGVVVIDRGDEVSGPQIVPWSSSRNVWRSAATYAIYTRSI